MENAGGALQCKNFTMRKLLFNGRTERFGCSAPPGKAFGVSGSERDATTASRQRAPAFSKQDTAPGFRGPKSYISL